MSRWGCPMAGPKGLTRSVWRAPPHGTRARAAGAFGPSPSSASQRHAGIKEVPRGCGPEEQISDASRADVLLSDGGIATIRSVTAEDEEQLLLLNLHSSDRTLHRRFFSLNGEVADRVLSATWRMRSMRTGSG